MENLKIFLASSYELKDDRIILENYIARLIKDYLQKNILLELVIWEDFIDAMAQTRLQDEYNKAIRSCDVFVMLFWNKVGKYTEEEFNTAFQHFEEYKKPFIYTYFKIAPSSLPKEPSLETFRQRLIRLNHFETVYFNKEGLQLHFGEQLNKLYKSGFKKIDKNQPSIEEYFNSLKIFNSSAYLTLSDGIDKPLSELFVPLKFGDMKMNEKNIISLENLLEKSNDSPVHVLVQGNPGGGKSTLLNYIALNVWENPQNIGLTKPFKYIPLYVRLQNLAKTDDVDLGKRLLNAMGKSSFSMANRISNDYYNEWPKSLNAQWLLLLDGYDEVDEKFKDALDILLLQLLKTNINIIITTRPTVSMPDKIRNLLDGCTIHDFDTTQKEELAHKLLPAKEDVTKFIAQINAYDRQNFSVTPLMLTVSAIVFSSRENELPDSEIKLYKEFLDIYLEEAFKRNENIYFQNISSKTTVNKTLGKIAFLMTENSDLNTLIEYNNKYSKLVARISEFLSPKLNPGLEEDEINELTTNYIKILGTKTGVFQCTGNICSWLHPTFREYLTAEHITNSMGKMSLEECWNFCKKWNEDRWRKIILFFIAQWSIIDDAGWIIKRIIAESQLVDDETYCQAVLFCSKLFHGGAKLNQESKLLIYQQLINIIESKIVENYCNRLFTDQNKVYSQKASEIVRQCTDDPQMLVLLEELTKKMVAFAKQQIRKTGGLSLSVSTSVFFDLRKLGLVEVLMEMARDESLDFEIRTASLYTLKEERWWEDGVRNKTIKSNESEYKLAVKNHSLLVSWKNEILEILLSLLHNSWTEENTKDLLRLMKDYEGFTELRKLVNNEHYDIGAIRIFVPEQLHTNENEEIFRDTTLDNNIRLMAALTILNNYDYNNDSEISETKKSVLKDIPVLFREFSEIDEADISKQCFMLEVLKNNIGEFIKSNEDDYLLNIAFDKYVPSFIRISTLSSLNNLESFLTVVNSEQIENGYKQVAACEATNKLTEQENDNEVFEILLNYIKNEKRTNPGNLKLHTALSQLYYKNGDHKDGKNSLAQLGDFKTDLAFAYRLKGVHEKNLVNYTNSIENFNAAIIINDDDYAKWQKAEVLMRQEKFHEAIAIFNETDYYHSIAPGYRWIHVQCFMKLKDYKEALTLCDKFLNEEKDATLFAFSSICKSMVSPADKLEHALKDINAAIELSKDYYYAIYHRHLIYRRQGELHAALEELEVYANERPYSPDFFEVKSLLILLLLRAGEINEASEMLAHLYEPENEEPFLLFLKGLIEFINRNKEKAQTSWIDAKIRLLKAGDFQSLLNTENETAVSNLMLINLLTENYVEAQQCLDFLISKNELFQLLNYTIPFIEDITFLTANKSIENFKNDLLLKLFPVQKEHTKSIIDPDILYSPPHPHDPYPAAMYCRLSQISGLEIENNWAMKILNQYKKKPLQQNERILVIFKIKDARNTNNIFGLCNFKKDASDSYNFKFCDTEENIINENLTSLLQSLRITILLFSHKDLAKKFKEAIDIKGLIAKCLLVHFNA